MQDDDAELRWLRDQVDGAVGEVRRTESVGPAATVAILTTCVPALIIFLVAVVRHLG